jgi:DNA mismatch endonuclease (patch repair protein)
MDTVSKAIRSLNMSRIRSKDTTPELIVRRLVHAAGFRYRLHVRGLAGRPDLVFPRLRKIIFVHGCFWHRHHCANGRAVPGTRTEFWTSKFESNVARDAAARRQLRREGWKVLVVWECETRVRILQRLQTRLIRFLSRP